MNGTELKQRYTSGDRNFQSLDLSGVDLSGIDLRKADFRGTDCYGTKFMDSLLNQANFSGTTNLAYANFRGADLSDANLSGANLEGANLEDTITQGVIYNNQTVFPIGFDPITAGAIHSHILEAQTRIAQITALKNQSISPSVYEPNLAEAVTTSIPVQTPPVIEPIIPETHLPKTPTTLTPTVPIPISEPTAPSLYELQPLKQSSKPFSYLGLFAGILIFAGLGYVLTNTSKLRTGSHPSHHNPFANQLYPRPACGDALPTDSTAYPLKMYPVFVDNPAQTLSTIRSKFCQDAYETQRQDKGQKVVQVASFLTQARAQQFAQFMAQNVGHGEVGTSTQIK